MVHELLIISDSHGNDQFLNKVLTQESSAGLIAHLGDYYEDLDRHEKLIGKRKVYKVPGIFNPGYKNKKIPFFLKFKFGEATFLMLHNLEDLTRISDISEVNFILFGHSHQKKFYKYDKYYFLNPGHIKKNIDRGADASYVLLQSLNKNFTIFQKNIHGIVTEKFDVNLLS